MPSRINDILEGDPLGLLTDVDSPIVDEDGRQIDERILKIMDQDGKPEGDDDDSVWRGVLIIPKQELPYAESYTTDPEVNAQDHSQHFILSMGLKALPLAESLGVPLAYVEWWEDSWGDSANKLVMALSIDLDERIQQEIDTDEETQLGSSTIERACVLFRYDKEPLEEQHVKALACYLDEHLQDIDNPDSVKERSEVDRLIEQYQEKLNEEAFEKFWYELKTRMAENGDESWKDVQSPIVPMTAARGT